MNTEYTDKEKLEYFQKLLEEQTEKIKVLEAKTVIAKSRANFLFKKVSELIDKLSK